MDRNNQNWIHDFITLYFTKDKVSQRRAMDLKDRHIPKKLYRYRPFRVGEEQQTLDEIESQNIFMQYANKLNDPFDSAGFCDFEKALLKLPVDRIEKMISIFLSSQETKHIPRKKVIAALQCTNWIEGVQQLVKSDCSIETIQELNDAILEWKAEFIKES